MEHFRIRKGLDIPLAGEPEQRIAERPPVNRVAVTGADIIGLRPRMAVTEGDAVRIGQPLFADRQNPDVPYASPGNGVVEAIHRGAKRALQSVVIRLDHERSDPAFSVPALDGLDGDNVRKALLASGLWTALRTRPFSKVPDPSSSPDSLFVTAIDTQPHSPNPRVVIAEDQEAFGIGLRVVRTLTNGKVYVCTRPDLDIAEDLADGVDHVTFSGPHPAGLVGTHIHLLSPVSERRVAWHLNYQDVMAVGRLFRDGRVDTSRVIALGGPQMDNPRLVRTRLGASVQELVSGELKPGKTRLLSGSALSGRRATGPIASWSG